jgi:hypothetical protein
MIMNVKAIHEPGWNWFHTLVLLRPGLAPEPNCGVV